MLRLRCSFGRLDVAVNNAGTEGHPDPVTEQTPESYAAVFDTNVLGTLLGMKHEMLVMAAQGGGSIVNLSSVLGKVGAPGAAVYTASKHAVEGLTKSAALEGAASGVRVNAVAPGPVETEMLNRFTGGGERKTNFRETVSVKRAATPEEIADTIVFRARRPFLPGSPFSSMAGRLPRSGRHSRLKLDTCADECLLLGARRTRRGLVSMSTSGFTADVTVAEVARQMGWFPLRGYVLSDTYLVFRAPRGSDPKEFGSLLRHPRRQTHWLHEDRL